MELTSEQYSQVFRYADGEMNENEKAFFEALLNSNEQLRTELNIYRKIQALCTSLDQKIDAQLQTEEEREENVRSMIAKARGEWEAEHESNIVGLTMDKKLSETEHPRRMVWKRWPYLAAAIVIGVLSLAIVWYLQKSPASPPVITAQKQPNKKPVIPIQKDTVATITQTMPPDSLQPNNHALPLTEKTKPVNANKLFAAYFKPDAVPQADALTIQEPFQFYEQKKYTDAIETFQMAKATLHTRGESEEKSNMPFYIHYYLGLSYMAAGKQSQIAIAELKAAIQATPNDILKSKAAWYLALAYLKNGNTEQAEKVLYTISSKQRAIHQQQAIDLIKALNKN